MVHLFKHLSFICPFTCVSGYNSDTITELERKCRRLQTQVFQMEVQWNISLPPPPRLYDDLVDPNVKTTASFYYFKYPLHATISLLQSGFYCFIVVASTGFHCSRDMIMAEIRKIRIFFDPASSQF